MAAVRGRKRTEDPTPNRARDIQRAFRARRAAHLESLEDRITELEEENNYLRSLLALPPANRPQLGKGPTGRGLAKSRSRITIDSFASNSNNGSPTPPSDSPTTPTMECPIPLPAQQGDPFPQIPSIESSDGSHINNGFQYTMDNKMVDPGAITVEGYYGAMGHPSAQDAMVDLPNEFESVSLSHGVGAIDGTIGNPSLFVDYPWGAQVQPTITVQPPEVEQNAQRAFSYTPQTIGQGMVPRPMTSGYRPQGHRRSHTEPQSLGSLIAAGFNPGHRASSSEAFQATPSPPPLPIRASIPAHVYQ